MPKEQSVPLTLLLWQASIDMNKKILITLVVILILPGLYFGGIIPISVMSDVYSPNYSGEELVGRSELIAHGTLVSSSSYVEWYANGNVVVPSVYTVWTMQSSELFKGQHSEIIEFVVNGGTYNNINQKTMQHIELNEEDDVIVFLSKDTDSIYKDNYYLTGIQSGVYMVKDDVAINNYTKSVYDVDSLMSLN